jgi:hypothetical protein
MLFPHCVGFFPVYLKKSAETLLAFLLKETSLSHAFYVNNQFQRKFLYSENGFRLFTCAPNFMMAEGQRTRRLRS